MRSRGMLEVSFGRLEKIPSSSWTRYEKKLQKEKRMHPQVGCGTKKKKHPGRKVTYVRKSQYRGFVLKVPAGQKAPKACHALHTSPISLKPRRK